MLGQPWNTDAAAGSAAIRMNEYFVPRDGIDREVISADICRYLGNDALVRPGHYEVWRAILTPNLRPVETLLGN
jgi:hypothetical protein